MGDLQTHGAITDTALSVHHGVVSSTCHLLDFLIFPSAIDDIFTCLLTWTAYISRRFINFIENLVLQDVYRCSEDSVTSEQHPRSSHESIREGCQSSSASCAEASSSGICGRRSSDLREGFLSNMNSGIIRINHSRRGVLLIFRGSCRLMMLPLFGFQHAWSLAKASWRCALDYLRCTQEQIYSLKTRMQKTLLGSSDDIGWLQNTPGMPPVENGTARFLELLEAVRNGEHTLPNSFVYLLVPGLFSNHGPLYFVATKRFFSKMGLACHIAKIHSEASVEHNAWELKQYIEELYWGSGKHVMLLGHSKGGVDSAAALSIYRSELEDKVAGLALVQSPYGGTPIASDILREGQIADKETRRIMELIICKIIKGDIRALEDLTYEKRKEFIMNHKLPEGIPLISFHSEAKVAPGVLATLSHIAHAELPWIPLP
ncbi:Lecithin:cholesterol/phospholipid:diacylglycerol acyltransferase, partial [Corchorus capsularis]